MFWYSEAWRFPFTESKGPSPTHEKQPHTINPHALCSQAGNILLASAKCRLAYRKHDSSLHRTCFHCSRVQWPCALHHSIRRLALYLVIWSLRVAAWPWKSISRRYFMPVDVWNSSAMEPVESWWLGDPTLWHYMVFRFVHELILNISTVLSNNTTYSLTISSRDNISQTD